MLISLVTLRLELAKGSEPLKYLKPYTAPKEDFSVKTYASVTKSGALQKQVKKDSSKIQKNSALKTLENQTDLDPEEFDRLKKDLDKLCRGDREYSEIYIEFIDSEAIKELIESVEMESKSLTDQTAEPSSSRGASTKSKVDGKPMSKKEATSPRTRETKSESDDRPTASHQASSKRPKSHSPQSKLPSAINFYCGNPSVELTKGILHIYKDTHLTSMEKDVNRSEMLCMLGVPASYTIHDLIQFIAPMGDCVSYMQVLRDAFPNQYLLLIKFRDQTSADDFFSYFNERPFNSIESHVCHLVYIAKVELISEDQGGSLPLMDLTELPNCPVCLEKMEEYTEGILTILCNHAFHTQCLAQWGDTSCPVCRYCQTPEEVADQRCMQCGSHESLWICLICGHVGCGRYVGLHAYKHFEGTNHTYAMQLGTNRVWDYAGDNYVHRLAQNKSDGKLVEVDEGGNEMQEEKLDSITLEYTYLLTTQLESQRLYFMEQIAEAVKDVESKLVESTERWEKERMEREKAECKLSTVLKEKQSLEKKCTQLHSRATKVLAELQEERQMNKCLTENQQQWQARVKDLENNLKILSEKKDKEIQDLQEQLRDVMFYLEAQQKLASTDKTGISQAELEESQVIVGAAATPPSGKKSRKKAH